MKNVVLEIEGMEPRTVSVPDEATPQQLSKLAKQIAMENVAPDPTIDFVDYSNIRNQPKTKTLGESLTRAAENFPSSFMAEVGGIVDMVKDPLGTAKNLTQFSIGLNEILQDANAGPKLSGPRMGPRMVWLLAQKIALGEEVTDADLRDHQANTEAYKAKANAFIEHMKNNYSSLEAAKETFESDPVGFASVVSIPFTAGSGLVKKVAAEGGTISKIAHVAETASKYMDPMSLTFKSLDTVAELSQFKKLMDYSLNGMADRLTTTYKGVSKANAIKISKDNFAGVEPGIWLSERGIKGSVDNIISKLMDIKSKSLKAVDDSLASVSQPVKSTNAILILNSITDAFNGINPQSTFMRNERFKLDYLRIKSKRPSGLTLSEMNEAKRMMDKYINSYSPTGNVKEGMTNLDMTKLRDQLKEEIEFVAEARGIPNIKELNKQTQVSDAIIKAMNTAKINGAANRMLSLTDIIFLSNTSDLGTAAGGLIGKKILESPRFKTAFADGLRRLSPQGIKELEQSVLSGYNTKVSSSLINSLFKDTAKNLGIRLGATIESENPDSIRNQTLNTIKKQRIEGLPLKDENKKSSRSQQPQDPALMQPLVP